MSQALGWESSHTWWQKLYQLFWIELDLPEAVLLVAGLSLLLMPLSLTGSQNSDAWTKGSFIAMLVLFLGSLLDLECLVCQKAIRALSHDQKTELLRLLVSSVLWISSIIPCSACSSPAISRLLETTLPVLQLG